MLYWLTMGLDDDTEATPMTAGVIVTVLSMLLSVI